jgi:hypothetical protein
MKARKIIRRLEKYPLFRELQVGEVIEKGDFFGSKNLIGRQVTREYIQSFLIPEQNQNGYYLYIGKIVDNNTNAKNIFSIIPYRRI